MAIGPASELGISLFEDTDPIELWPGHSKEEVETVIRAVYRQVLGNAYVMESERLVVPESQLKRGEISVREFVRQVAKSELYKSRFLYSVPRYRAIELNFKHLLGRAPNGYKEMAYHSSVLDAGGHDAEIDSYLDSDEYQEAYGQDTVPFYRGYRTQPGISMVEFTHIFRLLRGSSTSDKGSYPDLATPRLNSLIINEKAVPVLPITVAPTSDRTQYNVLTPNTEWGRKVLKITVARSPGLGANLDTYDPSDSSYSVVVPLNRLLSEMETIKRKGGRILNVTSVVA
ncbi:phycobilisome rod-core linker polypeptide [Gloeobacter kilaueensis]|uniref:Phycobilisome linker polypeptide n=1 Tax=Gloeobacter kilaueensis (strain ATCC BAA-2537 / CCAP 1431/1 / ULC 316 / JS1) TaxID=1183438 RepID=U5QSB4_GLOK1|nr:phycobilisome rod-core linker polypeptide [Gloeobacter kilaueensis]AGY60544.1 phycobilisome linker polypeptide [Gloeobacter kilaueensis JS1]